MKIKKTFETDWINSEPVFYNEKTKKVSNNINDVIDFNNFQFDEEGFNNYLDFGYSVFGQTPIKNVKFLDHSTKITVYDNDIKIKKNNIDPADKYFETESKEEDVIDKIETRVKDWENSTKEEILIAPLSGGYDARLLISLIKNKNRVKSFTFGLSPDQNNSFEVLYAKEMAKIMNISWDIIHLGDFHKFFDEWDDLYGISTHAHGMYHIEFYKKLIKIIGNNKPLISGGLNGSIWAGEIILPQIKSPKDLHKLSYSHGLHADSTYSLLKNRNNLKEEFWESNKHKLKEMYYRLLFSCRMKNTLLSYVLKVPQNIGFKPFAPYNEIDVALGMMTLPKNRWKNRIWQIDYFRKKGIFVEDFLTNTSKENTLDLQALYNIKPKELSIELLKEVIEPKYVEWINKSINEVLVTKAIKKTSKIKFFRKKQEKLRDKLTLAYNAYLTLRPIQNILEKRKKLYRSS